MTTNQNPTLRSSTSALMKFVQKRQEIAQSSKYFEVGATFLLISIFATFAIRPAIVTITGLIGEIKAKTELVSKNKDNINKVIIAQDSYSLIQSKYQILDQALPNNPAFTNLAIQIQGVSQKNSLVLKNLNFSLFKEETSGEGLKSYKLPISYSISYNQINPVLTDLQNLRRTLKFDSISLFSETDKQTKRNNIFLNLSPTVYYWSIGQKKK